MDNNKLDNNQINKNIECIVSRMPLTRAKADELLREYGGREGAGSEAFSDSSAVGETIIAVRRNNRIWYLNSRYDALKAARIWAESIGEFHYMSIFILCGIANGMYARELLKRLGDDNVLFIYEPDIEIFMRALSDTDLTDVLGDRRVYTFAEGFNMDIFRDYFKSVFRYELINFSKILIAPGYGRIYAKELESFNLLCLKETNFIQGEKNTLVDLGSEMIDNEIINLWKMMTSSTIDRLKEHIEGCGTDVDNIPVIIVSAGPSLDKNVEELKRAKGHALILAVDSAIRKMLAHDIIPDMIITIDSHKPLVLFEDDRIKNIPTVICGQTRCEVCKQQKGALFAFADDMFTWRFYRKLGKEISTLETGGSVANNAFSLARFMGFKNIILVGQDLAFTDNRKHATEVYSEKGIGEDENEKYTYVQGIDGKPILTYTNFCVYKEWFEGEIRDNPEYNVINATEGGADIKGAPNRILKEVIDEYCNCEFDASVLQSAPYEFEDNELEGVYNEIRSMLTRCDDVNRRFTRGIRDYMHFKELVSRGKNNTREFEKTVARLKDVNSINQQEPLIELISMYSKAEEYDIMDTMYTDEDRENTREASLRAADQGIQLLEGYKRALVKIRAGLTRLIDYEAAQDVYEVESYDILS